MAFIRFQVIKHFHPRQLITEELYNQISDTNYLQIFELIKQSEKDFRGFFKFPLFELTIGIAFLLLATITNDFLAIIGLFPAFHGGFSLVFTALALNRVPYNNKNMKDILTLVAIEKRSGTNFQDFYLHYVDKWYPRKVAQAIRAK